VQCDVATCDFLVEIRDAIEAKYKLNITPTKRKTLNVIEKEKPTVQIVKKRSNG
jgi:hypothetical protein